MKDTEKFAGAKYVVKASFTVDGVVEKHDVIGAIFGQTEGLFPKEFELRELQKSGKIGRIDIVLRSARDKTTGVIEAPSSLDRAETALIAAAMETVDRVGPCESRIKVESITDVRSEKRAAIVTRAKELMRDWVVQDGHEIEKVTATKFILRFGPESQTALAKGQPVLLHKIAKKLASLFCRHLREWWHGLDRLPQFVHRQGSVP